MKYKWLHISDLHSIAGIQTEIMRLSLSREVEDNRPYSFILITGDISNRNSGYTESGELINLIATKAGVSKDHIFIVPGNHDVNRTIPENRSEKCKSLWNTTSLIDSSEVIDDLVKGQADFFASYENILNRQYPPSRLHFVENFDKDLAIIHLNTAWMCFDSNNESGQLHLGLKQLNDTLKQTANFSTTPIKIAIGHHRVIDFNKTVMNNFKTMLKEYDIDLYLGGHCHESEVIYDPMIDVEFCACRQARAEDANYPAGFIIGNINTDTDQSYFEFYSWDTVLSKWTHDYSVNPAKHGKYYLNHPRYKTNAARSVIVDLKLMGAKLDIEVITGKYQHLALAEVYNTSLVNLLPGTTIEWDRCFREIRNLFDQVIQTSKHGIHIFPLAQIPALVYFGFLMQNNSPNVSIYQYSEGMKEWVCDESSELHQVTESVIVNGCKILAVSVSVSAVVQNSNIHESLGAEYDLYSVSIDQPGLDQVKFKNDVENIKSTIKAKLDQIHANYDEIHLYLAAPAGLCIEIGRIIRENMYPDTFVYQYNRISSSRYTRIANLFKIRGNS